MQARMRVTYVRDARAERTSPSSDTRPAHVHAGKGPENARRRQPRRTGRSTRRDDAITTEPRPPMLIGRLQRGASPQQLHPGNRTIDSKNRSAKKQKFLARMHTECTAVLAGLATLGSLLVPCGDAVRIKVPSSVCGRCAVAPHPACSRALHAVGPPLRASRG